MEKAFTDKNINIGKLIEDLTNSLKEDGWEVENNGNTNDTLLKGIKKSHFHKEEVILIRVRGEPNNVIISIDEENIGTLGRAWINLKLLGEIERKVNDGFYSQ
ncbi:hypothetical protein [Acidianus manzaensis]|uniref:Uncharacterized protein n=1 Tax=Acidianus manzaensis TaxID=282676 RepID=A0A1W6K2X4_9CREN|nr:hypothetical protein [Acidianus manzaensis]ARM76837.1 hypothetical protein B6F84_12950 [Acidianus manzaensis]